ncbi:U3 small nucleolar RNA-associated protein 20 [Emericellopsis cladophorae]|uniref:U3 small nucleolar RNA-associated protein 20 n=1 Tax=Emericellopsis cladophorae TaxID=2686198 RepID=A0A9P9Y013_9HYPO|nr:U3 small nucleolar RNA-associated protein 20 [Emericellopsis cladophorae]KAI6781059.1 U3 small nucleolar RNA-associated protein 20 [Emericellopsis cladophorae]
MPAKSSGRIVKARKYSTPHHKNHRYETFTAKVAKFNSLQPLRKVRRHDLDDDDLSATSSYFLSALQKWSELNVAKCFREFKQKVKNIDTLHQILHHEKDIWKALADSIARQEKESLEPLLEILTAFAHDLGTRFEKRYYTQSLGLIVDIAGKPQDADVIEWTFGALAFLFKFLSKHIVPNLQPTYDTVASLMGRSKHPPHIARFAAEALSFLVKKASVPSHRETVLPVFVNHVKDDLVKMEGDRQFPLYQDGVMTMFAEAIKGNDHTVHSAGPAIISQLMESMRSDDEKATYSAIWTDVTCGVLTSIIHHSTQSTFGEVMKAVLDKSQKIRAQIDPLPAWTQLMPLARVLGVAAGVRKGSRVDSWSELVTALVNILETIAKVDEDAMVPGDGNELWRYVLVPAAVTWKHAPIDSLLSKLGLFSKSLTRGPLIHWFIPFCAYVSDLDAQRFGNLLRADFQKFIACHWSQGINQQLLSILIPQMIERGAFPSAGERDSCKLPQDWQDQIVSKFENLEVSPFPERGPYNKTPKEWRDRCLPKYSALLRLMDLAVVHPSTNARVAELLLRKLKLALRPTSTLASDEVNFIVSQGFHAYLRMTKTAKSVDLTLSPLLRAAVPRFARSVGFLEGFLAYEEYLIAEPTHSKRDESSSDSSAAEEDPVIASLVENLGSPSHEIRLASLKLLQQLHDFQGSSDFVDIMIEVEQLPLGLEHTRTISMLLRNLGQKYSSMDESSWLQKGVPNFIFGMLTVKLSPVWDSASEALEQISQSKAGEEVVSAIGFSWLETPSPRWSAPANNNLGSNRQVITDFDCTFLRYLYQKADKTHEIAHQPEALMLQTFDERQETAPALAENARSKAIKVFNTVPFIAERRSRQLTPHFLPWALEDDTSIADELADMDQTYWSLADRKALLGVFAQFVNPRVLYLHEKVYDGMLQLLENGDVEVQKLALKAILAWKQAGVRAYQENLEYLLDDARFKNELTVLLQGDNVIKPEHRAELMPVLLRLLYGRTISKKGVASGKHGLQATRLAVLRNLSVDDMGKFLDIASGKLRSVKVVDTTCPRHKLFDKPLVHPRKQAGFLNMVSSLISELGTNVTKYMESLLNAVLYCLVFASRHLKGTALDSDDEVDDDNEVATSQSLLKMARSAGIKCLIMLFQNAQEYQWEPYRGIIIEEVIMPRLDSLSTEMTSGVSGVLQLLSTWAALPKTALFLGPHGGTLPKGILPPVIECLAAPKAKDDVRIFILEMICNMVRLALAPAQGSEFNELIKAELIDPNAEAMLNTITGVLHAPATSTALLDACVEALFSLAQVLQEPRSIEPVLRICSFLLQQPPRRVSPKTKGRVLLVVESFVSLIQPSEHEDLCNKVYETLSSLFSYFKDRENREALSRALSVVAAGDAGKSEVAALCAKLNSFKKGCIEEPDYDQRLSAFTSISKERAVPLTAEEWLPLLHNCIYFIHVDEEFGVLATNSADGLRRFVQDTATSTPGQSADKLKTQLGQTLLPAIYTGIREPSETTRREILRVFGFIICQLPQWDPVHDLKGLLNESSEDSTEPPFFFNILSPAVARQQEALRGLEEANKLHEISSQNLAQFFIPLLEHFIIGRQEKIDDHGLGALATTIIGSLAESLHWKHYRTILQRYIGYIASRPEQQKQTIRLLGKFTDALITAAPYSAQDAMDVDATEAPSIFVRRLSLTMPKQSQLATDIVEYFLPMLSKHLHEKDESEVSYRVPVGVTIVKLLKLLPSNQMDQKLAGALTDICHILRSKATESRDLARDTLVQIAKILGAGYFGFLLRELRGALTKGYQLHVLSYTMHSILVAVIPDFESGDLDYCLPSIITVIMDDIFGVIGQEKDAEGYTTQMKEIKSSKSQDSMELISRTASITRLIDLIRPLQSLLMQKVDLKMVRKIDNLLSRVSVGLLQNPAAESRDTLVFCYEVIQDIYKAREPQVQEKIDPKVRKYLVQKGVKKQALGRTTQNTSKLMRFTLDTLRSVFKKHDSLRTPENLAGFLPILGDSIIDGEDEVKVSTFRLLAVISKVPFKEEEGTTLYRIAVKEATKAISTSVSTTTELSQAALRMLSVVLRDRKDIAVKEAAIDMMLGKLKDDLTEPQYRHVTFNFLRSVLERHVETAAVYDTMDYVGTVMITNDDRDTRDLARGAFFQFIREYPQKKSRWAKQLNFIVANLKYQREGGRLSVMEVVHLLLMKSSDDFVQEIAATCFLPLFLVLANDDSDKCCRSAAELLKEIFRQSDRERTQKFLTLLRSWLDKDDNEAVLTLALKVWTFYFESNESACKNQSDFKLVFAKVMGILGQEDIKAVNGELLEAALGLIHVWFTVFADKVLSAKSEDLWAHVGRCMEHGHPPVKVAAIKLISLYLSDFAPNMGSTLAKQPVPGSHGLQLDDEKVGNLVHLALYILNGYNVHEALGAEAGQILIFLAPRLPAPAAADESESDDGDESQGDEGANMKDDAHKPKDLQYLFWRISHILRKEISPNAVSIGPKVTAMEVLETVCRRTTVERLTPSLKTILTPLQNITDPTIRPPQTMDEEFNTKYEHIKTRAQILMDSLQKKFGTEEYSRVLMLIREEVKARRLERSSKRKIEAVAHPEKYGRDKRKKFEKNRDRKKVRASENKARRQAFKNW